MHLLVGLAVAATATSTTTSVALVAEEAASVERAELDAILFDFARAIRGASTMRVVVDRGLWSKCVRADRCASEIRETHGATDVVFVRLFKAGTGARMIAERVGVDETVLGRVQMDMDYVALRRPRTLERLASLMFDRAVDLRSPPPAHEAPNRSWIPIAGWVGVGAGAAAFGAGLGFRLSGDAAADRVEGTPLSPSMLDEERDRARAHLTASNLLFGTAVALISVGVTMLVLPD